MAATMGRILRSARPCCSRGAPLRRPAASAVWSDRKVLSVQARRRRRYALAQAKGSRERTHHPIAQARAAGAVRTQRWKRQRATLRERRSARLIAAHVRRPGDVVGQRFQRQASRRVADFKSGQRVLRLSEETTDGAIVMVVRTVGANARRVGRVTADVEGNMARVIVPRMAARSVSRRIVGMLNERVQTLAKQRNTAKNSRNCRSK